MEVLESMIVLDKLDAEKRNILDIADIDLRLPLHDTAQEHPDPTAIKLQVRRHHPALLAKSGGGQTPLDCAILKIKSPAVVTLLRKLTTAYKHGHFSGLIHLCGTSPSLEALAVRSTDDVPLLVLCQCDSWEVASKRIDTIPVQATIEEMHKKDEQWHTTFAIAVVADAPVELLERMVELGEQDTKERRIAQACDKKNWYPLYLAALHRTDITATIKLVVGENPTGLYHAIKYALEHNKKSTAVVSLLHKCLAAFEHETSPLCGESNHLLEEKKYVERHPVHFAAAHTSDIAIIKPVILVHAPQLLTKDGDGNTPLDRTKLNPNSAVVLPFVTEADTAFRAGNYPALIKLCGSTPAWKHEVKFAKDKKDKDDAAEANRLEAKFFDWDENGVRENSASQPPPPPPTKEKKKKKPKK